MFIWDHFRQIEIEMENYSNCLVSTSTNEFLMKIGYNIIIFRRSGAKWPLFVNK